MENFILGIFLVCAVQFQFVSSMPPALGRPPRSPCPVIFSYHRTDDESRWIGVVRVLPPETGLPLMLDIKLSLGAALPSKFVGRLKLADEKSVVLDRIMKNDYTEIYYYVDFPLVHPLPYLVSIRVNGKIVCSGFPVTGRIVTTINLEHALFPVLADDKIDIRKNPVSTSQVNAQSVKERCGQPTVPLPLMANGETLQRGIWPWIVAIFVANDIGIQFYCSGTLVTLKHVLTVAHCFEDHEGESIDKKKFIFFFGKYNLKDWTEKNTQTRTADFVYVHPQADTTVFANDIAIAVMGSPVEMTSFVRPICMWNDDTDLNLVVGRLGAVVGWGRDETGKKLTNVPKMTRMPIVSQETCLASNGKFRSYVSDTTFCAGFRNGSGPCTGDSGGGFMLSRPTRDGGLQWILRGIVSFSIRDSSTLSCDLSHYVVFTDVTKYSEWINNVVREHG